MNKSYVYIIQNLERTHWYVGYRQRPKAPAQFDTSYWSSSTYLKRLIEQTGKAIWTKVIVKEFDTWEEAKEHEDELLELLWDLPGRVNKSKPGYVDHDCPEVRAKNKLGSQKRSQNASWKENQAASIRKKFEDPEHREKMKISNQNKANDPEWRSRVQEGIKQRDQDPNYKANRAAMFASAEWKENVNRALEKRRKPFIATSVATGEEFYCESLRCEFAKANGLDSGTISGCLRSGKAHRGFTYRYA